MNLTFKFLKAAISIVFIGIAFPYLDLTNVPIMILEFLVITLAATAVTLILLKQAKWGVAGATMMQTLISSIIKGFLIAGFVSALLFWLPMIMEPPKILTDPYVVVMVGVMLGEAVTWGMIKLQPKEMVV